VILLLGNTSFNNLQNSFDILSYFFDIGKTWKYLRLFFSVFWPRNGKYGSGSNQAPTAKV
jgi:hypothetical protein